MDATLHGHCDASWTCSAVGDYLSSHRVQLTRGRPAWDFFYALATAWADAPISFDTFMEFDQPQDLENKVESGDPCKLSVCFFNCFCCIWWILLRRTNEVSRVGSAQSQLL